MGFALSWIAVRGKARVEIWKDLSFRPSGDRRGDWWEAPIVGAQRTNGWYVIMTDNCDSPLLNDGPLTRLSSGAEVVSCAVEEHCMYSGAAGWQDGKKIWSVIHNSFKGGVGHLEKEGAFPAIFAPIHDELTAKQKEQDSQKGFLGLFKPAQVDYLFDIPVRLSAGVTGFSHEQAEEIEYDPENEDPYEVLVIE